MVIIRDRHKICKIRNVFQRHRVPSTRHYNAVNRTKKIYFVYSQFFYNRVKPWLVCYQCVQRLRPGMIHPNEEYELCASLFGDLPSASFKQVIFFNSVYPFHVLGYVYCLCCYKFLKKEQ